jgi:putative membrane protein
VTSASLKTLFLHLILLAAAFWSGYDPADRFTWYLEVIPGFLGWAAMLYFSQRSSLSFGLQCVFTAHIFLLFVGGHYTYAEVPGFRFDLPFLGGVRNHFDKLGHFFQGISPTLITIEVVRRKKIITSGRWRSFFALTTALAFSAFYELVEWWVSAATGEGGDAFLGTQGYVWDTQSDMFLALLGALFAVMCSARQGTRS